MRYYDKDGGNFKGAFVLSQRCECVKVIDDKTKQPGFVLRDPLMYEVKVLTETNEECQQWMLIMQDAIFYRKLIAGDVESLQKFERQTSTAQDSDLGAWLKQEGLDEGIGLALESLGARTSEDVKSMSVTPPPSVVNSVCVFLFFFPSFPFFFVVNLLVA